MNGSNTGALQSVDYTYNARGWLSGINQMPVSMHNAILRTRNGQQVLDIDPNPTYNIASGEGSVDLFSESIRYDAPDANFAAVTPQYNGNISQIMWQVAGKERQAYTYSYDPIDRMTAGVYTDVHDEYIAELAATIGQPYDPTFERDNKYNETLTYDVRGNITKLSRNGMYTLTQNNGGYLKGTFGQIDSLNYTYNNQNQVTKIVDNAPAANREKGFKYTSTATTAYTYDANGNLKSDLNKGISNIVYNYMNLPERIEFFASTNPYRPVIDFVYDATGMKLRKTATLYNSNMTTFLTRTTTDYMDGFEYEDDKIQRIAHTEGYISRREKRSNESSEFVGLGGLVWQYNYVLKDHLGNTRVTFADTTGNGLIDPTIEIAQINHFYPFGLNMDGNWNGASGSNKYQLTGKEWNDDFGLGMNDFSARLYDPAIGRWNAVDPLAEKFMSFTPYNYVMNRPLIMIDPTGMEATFDAKTGDLKHADGKDAANWLRGQQKANGISWSTTTNSSGNFTVSITAKIKLIDLSNSKQDLGKLGGDIQTLSNRTLKGTGSWTKNFGQKNASQKLIDLNVTIMIQPVSGNLTSSIGKNDIAIGIVDKLYSCDGQGAVGCAEIGGFYGAVEKNQETKVFVHEIGHLLGLDDNRKSGSIMSNPISNKMTATEVFEMSSGFLNNGKTSGSTSNWGKRGAESFEAYIKKVTPSN